MVIYVYYVYGSGIRLVVITHYWHLAQRNESRSIQSRWTVGLSLLFLARRLGEPAITGRTVKDHNGRAGGRRAVRIGNEQRM